MNRIHRNLADRTNTKQRFQTDALPKSILEDKELDVSTISKMEIVQNEGDRRVVRQIEHYNLDMIIAVGYRVNSKKATEFRKWATSVLTQYLRDGYIIDEKRLRSETKNNF